MKVWFEPVFRLLPEVSLMVRLLLIVNGLLAKNDGVPSMMILSVGVVGNTPRAPSLLGAKRVLPSIYVLFCKLPPP